MSSDPFDALDAAAETGGAAAVFSTLVEHLREDRQYARLFDTLLMKKRHELGLPLAGVESISELSEDVQLEVENYYMACCREVGGLFLEAGDLESAWPYFRTIDEPARVAEALSAWSPPAGADEDSTRAVTERIVEIALNEGANVRKGFELLLDLGGPQKAIDALETTVPPAGPVRDHCARLLLERVHRDLRGALLEAIQAREASGPAAPAPSPGAPGVTPSAGSPGDETRPLARLAEEHPEVFAEGKLPADESLIRAAIRVASTSSESETLQMGIELTETGRCFPSDPAVPGPPPFDDFYPDARIYLLALSGTGADGAVHYFRKRAEEASPQADGKHTPGEVLVTLLARLGRYQEAVDAYTRFVAPAGEPARTVPRLPDLCEKAGDYGAWIRQSREASDLLQYTMGLVRRDDARRAWENRAG